MANKKTRRKRRTVLTPEQVAELREYRARGRTLAQCARRFRIHPSTASRLLNGKTQATVLGPKGEVRRMEVGRDESLDSIRARIRDTFGNGARIATDQSSDLNRVVCNLRSRMSDKQLALLASRLMVDMNAQTLGDLIDRAAGAQA